MALNLLYCLARRVTEFARLYPMDDVAKDETRHPRVRR
jgi:hypothetical protein